MGMKVLGVVLGYVLMLVVVFGGLAIAYWGMDADGAFQAGTYDTSMAWNIVMLAVGIVAAIVGGLACRRLSRSKGATQALAIVVLVLGAAMAIPVFTGAREDPGPREADVNMAEAMSQAQQPVWTAVANPIIGAVGVLIGGMIGGSAGRGDETGPTPQPGQD